MKVHAGKIAIAALVAIILGTSAGVLASPGWRSFFGRLVSSPHTTTTVIVPGRGPAASTADPIADGTVVYADGGNIPVTWTFPANNGFDATLHIEVYKGSTKLAWKWENKKLDTPQTIEVDVPTKYVRNGDVLLVHGYYTDRAGDFTPYDEHSERTVHIP